jgi:uncharacterized protein (TIGR02453 family)
MPSFSPALFSFLAELAAHNEREWFTTHKARFEADVKAPLLAFVDALAPRLAEIDPDARCDAKSVFRIYRDTRFSADKRPYKTHAAAHFPRATAEKGPSSPGYYLHLEPGGSFLGAGLWMPDGPALTRIRNAIDTRRATWVAVRDAAGPLGGESLTRVPRGFPADHPLADDLKHKSFTTGIAFTEAEVCAPDFVDRFAAACARVAPFVGFLADATAG